MTSEMAGARAGRTGPRLVVVTGGGTGIGRAITDRLTADGDDVIIVGRRPGVLAEAAADINRLRGAQRVRSVVADLSDSAAVPAVLEAVATTGRPLDVLVNNAGGNVAPTPAPDLAGLKAQYLQNFAGNVLTAVLVTHALLPCLRRPGGRIITIGSIAAYRGNASYGAAKAALHPWASELAARVAADGITVNVVAPGYVGNTEFYGPRMTPSFHSERSAQAPVGRGGEAEEIAALVGYLAGGESGFLTGQVIQINGGALLGR